MTLNITIVTSTRICQSSDCRLMDLREGKHIDVAAHKSIIVPMFRWTATVCFAGVAVTSTGLVVEEWLSSAVAALGVKDTIDDLLVALQHADSWLSTLAGDRRITFSVGAFGEHGPQMALVSNFQQISGPEAKTPWSKLRTTVMRPTRPVVFVAGHTAALTRLERLTLRRAAAELTEHGPLHERLAVANRAASSRSRLIGPQCCTSILTSDGHFEIRTHGYAAFSEVPAGLLPGPGGARALDKLRQLLPPGAHISQVAGARSLVTESELRRQALIGNSADAWNAYGAALSRMPGKVKDAAAAYHRALQMDSRHASAHSNMARLLASTGEHLSARPHVDAALASAPNDHFVLATAAFVGLHDPNSREECLAQIDRALGVVPTSSEYLYVRAMVLMVLERFDEAVAACEESLRDADSLYQAKCLRLRANAALFSTMGLNEVLAQYRTVQSLSKSSDPATQAEMAVVLLLLGRAEEGFKMAHGALVGEPSGGALIHYLRVVHAPLDNRAIAGSLIELPLRSEHRRAVLAHGRRMAASDEELGAAAMLLARALMASDLAATHAAEQSVREVRARRILL